VDEWLAAARDSIARATDLSREQLDLAEEEVRVLLELARIAAHDSGERTNAPLLCYLLGRATAAGSADLDTLAAVVRRTPA